MPAWRRMLARYRLHTVTRVMVLSTDRAGRPVWGPGGLLLSESNDPAPLAVLLSHRNIIFNCRQMSDVLNTRLDDVILSCIPLYHPLGLTLTTIMPLVEGIPIACHGDPLDSLGYREVSCQAPRDTVAGLTANNRALCPQQRDSPAYARFAAPGSVRCRTAAQ